MAKQVDADMKKIPDPCPAVNLARKAMYRFAALSLLDPRAGAWQQLNALRDDTLLTQAADLIRGLPSTRSTVMGQAEWCIDILAPQRVLAHLPRSEQALNAWYERTFGLLVSCNCPPYEMEYVNSKFTFQRSHTLADIGGYYRAFGLAVSDLVPERPDHVMLELEFMATLIGLHRQAAATRTADAIKRQQICLDAQKRFLREHLTWWVPAFCKLLILQDSHGFYAAVGTFLASFLEAERAMFGIAISSERVGPTTEERPEYCEGCELAG